MTFSFLGDRRVSGSSDALEQTAIQRKVLKGSEMECSMKPQGFTTFNLYFQTWF